MLNLKQTRFVNSQHLPVVPGASIVDEGIALVAVMLDGATHVKPSTGVAGEVFAGVSFARNTVPQFVSTVVEEVIPASLVVDLGRVPAPGQISATSKNPATGVTTALTVVSAAPASATEVQVTAVGKAVFFAGEAGNVFKACFHYTPAANEAQMIKGNVGYGQLAATQLSIIGVLTNNPEISTSYFDASVDWSAATASGAPAVVSLGADGKFTVGGTGTKIANCIVLSAPGVDSPFLTLKIGQ